MNHMRRYLKFQASLTFEPHPPLCLDICPKWPRKFSTQAYTTVEKLYGRMMSGTRFTWAFYKIYTQMRVFQNLCLGSVVPSQSCFTKSHDWKKLGLSPFQEIHTVELFRTFTKMGWEPPVENVQPKMFRAEAPWSTSTHDHPTAKTWTYVTEISPKSQDLL